jgi:hypothetical protein
MMTYRCDHPVRALILGLTLSLIGFSQTAAEIAFVGEANVLTDLTMPFPPGCISLTPPQQPASAESIVFEGVFDVPTVGAEQPDAEVGVTIWRVGCQDEGYSVIMLRLDALSSHGDVLIPQVFADPGLVPAGRVPMHVAQLLRSPATGEVGATGEILRASGEAFMLAVDPISLDGTGIFTPNDYNDLLSVELYWGDYSRAAPLYEAIVLDEYSPGLDPPQFERMPLHGRMSGKYTFAGLPSAGLALSIGEQADDSNFIFAIFFTYLEGQPFWVVGNTVGQTPGFTQATLTMQEVSGGQFINQPGSYSDEADIVREDIGTLRIEALDCNRIAIDYDFSAAGLGRGRLIGQRLVRIAGYDCNPWR